MGVINDKIDFFGNYFGESRARVFEQRSGTDIEVLEHRSAKNPPLADRQNEFPKKSNR
jgi:hypothetical protein